MPEVEASPFTVQPAYAVVFDGGPDLGGPFEPLPYEDPVRQARYLIPHGLDRQAAAALPGLWYCLHLPNIFAELVDIPLRTLHSAQNLHFGHQILFVPLQFFDAMHCAGWLEDLHPTLALCPDHMLADVRARSADLGFALPAAAYKDLSDESLREHWRAIHQHFLPTYPYLGREPALSRRLDLAPASLPLRWLTRQMDWDASLGARDGDPEEILYSTLLARAVLSVIVRLEDSGVSRDVAKEQLGAMVAEEQRRVRVPVSFALLGVAPAYARTAYTTEERAQIKPFGTVDPADVWSPTMHQRADGQVERSTAEFVVTHQAIAHGGLGLMLPSVPAEAFTALGELERHFATMRPNGPTTRRLLERLNAATTGLWSEHVIDAIEHASIITAFSNFPLGLTTMPGDSSPLSARVPITYRPLLPLTRTLQLELDSTPSIVWTDQVRVLVAECIPVTDPVGQMARVGWQAAQEGMSEIGGKVTMEIVETPSIDHLRSAYAERYPDILVVCAHGDTNGAVAGLVIGNELQLNLNLDPAPPLVILSACHVAPRGSGAVSVSDLLLREGAMAVLGTQVPIEVFRNSMLMMRFFIYLSEVLSGKEEHATLLELWHRVQSSNAVHDILDGSSRLRAWGWGPSGADMSVIADFKTNRSAVTRPRLAHSYKDSEALLGAIADEQGKGDQVRGWFTNPGYVPESLFYTLIGRPERIYLPARARQVMNPTR